VGRVLRLVVLSSSDEQFLYQQECPGSK
jgi:hypothetical protein